MSDDNDRRFQRFAAELDLVLADRGGAVIDAHARANDIGPRGFRAETHVPLAEGAKLAFKIVLGNGDKVEGLAEVVWVSQNQWGSCVAGAKITKISWRDSSKLKRAITRPGYDFVALARKALVGIYIMVVVVGLQNALFEQSLTRELLVKLLPVGAALAALGWSLLVLLRR